MRCAQSHVKVRSTVGALYSYRLPLTHTVKNLGTKMRKLTLTNSKNVGFLRPALEELSFTYLMLLLCASHRY